MAVKFYIRTSGLNSVNSRPRQSNSMTFWRVGGEACWYELGGALMVAEDSRCLRLVRNSKENEENCYFTRLAFPYKVGFPSTSTHIVCLLHICQLCHCSFSIYTSLEFLPLTNRLTLTKFGWISRQEVHCTLKVYQNGFSGVSSGRSSLTLYLALESFQNKMKINI